MTIRLVKQVRLHQDEVDHVEQLAKDEGFSSVSHLFRYGVLLATNRKNKNIELFNSSNRCRV